MVLQVSGVQQVGGRASRARAVSSHLQLAVDGVVLRALGGLHLPPELADLTILGAQRGVELLDPSAQRHDVSVLPPGLLLHLARLRTQAAGRATFVKARRTRATGASHSRACASVRTRTCTSASASSCLCASSCLLRRSSARSLALITPSSCAARTRPDARSPSSLRTASSSVATRSDCCASVACGEKRRGSGRARSAPGTRLGLGRESSTEQAPPWACLGALEHAREALDLPVLDAQRALERERAGTARRRLRLELGAQLLGSRASAQCAAPTQEQAPPVAMAAVVLHKLATRLVGS